MSQRFGATQCVAALFSNILGKLKLSPQFSNKRLGEANKSFIGDFGTRSTEVSTRISGDVRAARVIVDEIFKNICNVTNAMVLLNGEADYSTFIDKVNYQIDYYKNTINIRRSPGKPKTDSTNTPA